MPRWPARAESLLLVAIAALVAATAPSVASDRTPGTVFRDCPECPEMVVAPAGSFVMGSPQEGPQRTVTLAKPFAVGKFEITRDEFDAFVTATDHTTGDKCFTVEGNELAERSGLSFRSPGFEQTGTHPAVCVSWADAKAYVAWLSQKTGQPYRLLSEAEWEYATRAGTSTSYSFGDKPGDLCGYANGADETARPSGLLKTEDYAACKDGSVYTAVVGSFKPNTFGLYDMHGNVSEWVEDCYADSYAGAPTDGSASTSGECSHRFCRGGSWFSSPRALRSNFRGKAPADIRGSPVGLRVGRTLTPTATPEPENTPPVATAPPAPPRPADATPVVVAPTPARAPETATTETRKTASKKESAQKGECSAFVPSANLTISIPCPK